MANPLKVYDPYITNDIVSNQYHDFNKFLNDVELVVVMVKHDEIKNNKEKLKGKIILDTQNIIDLPNVEKL